LNNLHKCAKTEMDRHIRLPELKSRTTIRSRESKFAKGEKADAA
jgi:hypothetical protein